MLHRNTYIVSAMRLSRNAFDNVVLSVLLAELARTISRRDLRKDQLVENIVSE